MNPGDLVRVKKFPCILTPMEWGSEEFVEWKCNSKREGKVEFKVGEAGTVLEVGGKNSFEENNVRILVPGGIGWCSQHWVKVISETR